MHGGIGMVDEYKAGLDLKRARVFQYLFGGYTYHMDEFARQRFLRVSSYAGYPGSGLERNIDS